MFWLFLLFFVSIETSGSPKESEKTSSRDLLKVLVLAIAFLPDEVRRTSVVDPVQKTSQDMLIPSSSSFYSYLTKVERINTKILCGEMN